MCSGNKSGKIKTLNLVFPSPRVNPKGKLPKAQGKNKQHLPLCFTALQTMGTN